MKILFIAPMEHPVSAVTGSSVEISIYQIAKRLSRNHMVTIISRRVSGLPKFYRSGNLKIVRIPGGQQYLSKAITYMKKHKFDCIQVDNRPSYLFALRQHFRKTPIILSLHSLTFMRNLPKKVSRSVFQKATAIVCNSNFIRKYYAKQFPGMGKKFNRIHLGVNLSRFNLSSPYEKKLERHRYSLNSFFNILYVGRVIPQKGVHTLVSAVGIVRTKLPRVRLVVVGNINSPMYKQRLLTEARRANVPLKLIGKIPPSRIHRAYRLGDCLVCPTQFQEAFGLVIIEAMASGIPVVASRRGGIPEIINGSNGILVNKYRQPSAYAQAIEKLIRSSSLSQSLAIKGHETVVNKFSWDNVTDRFDQLYRRYEKNPPAAIQNMDSADIDETKKQEVLGSVINA